jgi:hypothetical protein
MLITKLIGRSPCYITRQQKVDCPHLDLTRSAARDLQRTTCFIKNEHLPKPDHTNLVQKFERNAAMVLVSIPKSYANPYLVGDWPLSPRLGGSNGDGFANATLSLASAAEPASPSGQ